MPVADPRGGGDRDAVLLGLSFSCSLRTALRNVFGIMFMGLTDVRADFGYFVLIIIVHCILSTCDHISFLSQQLKKTSERNRYQLDPRNKRVSSILCHKYNGFSTFYK